MTHRSKQPLEDADLYLLGIGIKGFTQVTTETLEALRSCRVVLHLSDQDSALRRVNKNTIDLNPLYWTGQDRSDVYRNLVRAVLEEVQCGPRVALVGYGHPLIFDQVCAQLRRRIRALGLKCTVLAGISCLDTLCIDLAIDYGDGLQLFEASHLVESELEMCTRLHTLIFQVYEFGENRTADTICPVRGRLEPLQDYLSRYYPEDHRVTLVYSDNGDGEGSVLVRTRIDSIDRKQDHVFPGISLCISPLTRKG